MDELGQSSHKSLVALHSARRVDQNHVVMLVLGLLKRLLGNDSWIIFVTFLVQRKVEAVAVSLQLLNRSRSEVVAASKHDLQITLGFEVVGRLCERSGLANSVNANEDNAVDLTPLLSTDCLLQNVDVLLGRHETLNGFNQGFLNCGFDRGETGCLGVQKARSHLLADFLGYLNRHVFVSKVGLELLKDRVKIVCSECLVARVVLER